MKKYLSTIAFFYLNFLSSFLFADPTLPGVIAATDGDPNAIIGGCVNAITGDLVLSNEDIVVRGAVPLSLHRQYASGDGEGYNAGWQFFFPHFHLKFQLNGQETRESVLATTPSGSSTYYLGEKHNKGRHEMRPNLTRHALGMTNNSSGIISGRTNYKNNRICFKETKKGKTDVHLVTGDGLRCFYEPFQFKGTQKGFDFLLAKEELPNGCWILYEHDQEGRPTLAKVVNPSQDKVFSWARFSYEGSTKENHNIHVATSDHRELHYLFERTGSSKDGYRFYLQSISGTGIKETLVFGKPPKGFNPLVTEIKQSDVTTQKIAYWYPDKKHGIKDKEDLRCNRVKELWRPSGPNGELICTHQISYPQIAWRQDESCCKTGGVTKVTGPDGYKAEYRWAKELRPLAIRLFDTNTSPRPLLEHRFFWGENGTHAVGDLQARSLVDSNDQYVWIKTYEYDKYYNPIRETIHGNLSGNCQTPLKLKNNKVEGGEKYSHTYKYSNDKRNLLVEDRGDNGIVVQYHYLPNTSLLKAKLISDGQNILQRSMYEYDADNLLIAESADDGTSSNLDDFSNVTHRSITRTFRRADGLPERIEERYYDPAQNCERLLKATAFHYNADLLVSQEDVYDANRHHTYSVFYKYDGNQRLISQTDPLGQTTSLSYDTRGRPNATTKPDGLFEGIMYNALSQPLLLSQQAPGGHCRITYISYSSCGHQSTITNPQGHVLRFISDPWGKNKKLEHPDGSSEFFEYNALGLPTCHISRTGLKTTIQYNSYGKPTFKQSTDGTSESFSYDLSGRLIKKTNHLGTTTLYTYDTLDRPTHIRTVDASGTLLSEEHTLFRGPHLIEHTNAEGEKTTYTYDSAGRKIAEDHNGGCTHFAYDARGLLSTTSTQEASHETIYDVLGRKIEEKTIGSSGELHHHSSYTYDSNNNVLTTTIHTLQGPSTTRTEYDPFGRIKAQYDALGHQSTLEWDETRPRVIKKTTTDPCGTQSIDTIGPMESLLSKEIRSPSGATLITTTYTYNKQGQCIEERAIQAHRTVVTKREYTLDKLTTLIEAAGTPEEKRTTYTYNKGLLTAVTKNDGVQLSYSHDGLGRVATCQASTGDGYVYTYDRLSRITSVTDLSSGLTSTRSYHSSGGIHHEKFLHGLTITYERDPFGKPLALHLPDQSGIAYAWEASRLRSISRFNASGSSLYHYTYEQFDLTGAPLVASLIAGLGKETFSYDLAQHLEERASRYYSQTATKRNPIGNLLSSTTRYHSEYDYAWYTYDDLQQLKCEDTTRSTQNFDFDAQGVPLTRDNQTCNSNHLHQVTNIGEKAYTYTPSGNLLTDDRFIYHYDAFDRLVTAEIPNVQKSEYIYDSWHRRMQKVLYIWKNKRWVTVSTHSYLYDGMYEIGAVDEKGTLVELRVLSGPSQGEAGKSVAIEIGKKLYAPLHDLRGNITGLVDAAKKRVIEFYHYTAFGTLQILGPDTTPQPNTEIHNPWLYFSKRTDPETGLILFGRRYYHTGLNSWITPDPAQNIDHPNLYLFLRSNPLNLLDALGFCAHAKIENSIQYNYQQANPYERFKQDFGRTLYYTSYQLPIPYIREGLQYVGAKYANHPRCLFEKNELIRLKADGKNDGRAVVFINGVGNTYEDITGQAYRMSDGLNNRDIFALCNKTDGYVQDGVHAVAGLCGIKTEPVRVGIEAFNYIYSYLKQVTNNPEIIVICHSEGCILAKQIFTELKKTNPEINAHTATFAFGAPTILEEDLTNTVKVYISRWDTIGWMDFEARRKHCRKNYRHVEILEPVLNPSDPNMEPASRGTDHAINGATYSAQLEKIYDALKGKWKP